MTRSLRRLVRVLGALSLAASLAAGLCFAASVFNISQYKRAFSESEITIAAGDVIAFSNDDEFIHQIYTNSPTFSFDTDESPPGNTIQIKFKVPGTFEVHCHIHPKMSLIVHVQ
jgi:plastocyanin